MSHRPGYYDRRLDPGPTGRHANGHSRRQPKSNINDYTLTHGGRQVRIGPVAFWIVVGSLVIMAGWSAATGTYFAFHDDVLKRLIGRQAEMQYAYEDRIAELRAQVDRITSRQLLDQEQFEKKLDQILNRQAVLEQRATALNNLPDTTVTGSIKPSGRNAGDSTRGISFKPAQSGDNASPASARDRQTSLWERLTGKRAKGGLEGMLARLSDSLDKVEARQMATLNTLEETYDSKTRRMRSALADLGLDPGKTNAGTMALASATGGPYVPVRPDAGFERQLYRVNVARNQVDRLTRTLSAIPVRKPIFGDIDMSSPFGMRMDPFVKGPAIHTGIDMRGDPGDPVRATANGTVTVAGWNGGYGKMIEIDHGNGLATRYGHLSAIDVRVGQSIRIGQIIGKIGSTGRSTGPHLHYETRVEGEAVNPQKFLNAGVKLGAF